MFFLCYNLFKMGDNMNIVIRNYEESDYDTVDKILYDTFGYHKEHLSDNRTYEFVACLDNIVVGYYYLAETIDIIRNIKTFHVEYVCVQEDYRGKGIGKLMMEHAISYAKKNNAARLELTSGNKREVAHKLYLSMGYEKRDTSVFRKELL